jgi:glutaredoxin 3
MGTVKVYSKGGRRLVASTRRRAAPYAPPGEVVIEARPAAGKTMEAMSDVVVYTTNRCGYCIRVKTLLKSRGVDFEEVDLSRDPAAFVELAQRTGMMTVPQVMIGDRFLGGYQETAEADRTGWLAQLLAA